MGARERGAGDVGGQDGEFVALEEVVAAAVADEPDEARAEHGVGGRDEGAAEGVDRGEGLADGLGQVPGHGVVLWIRTEGREELVVGPGHAGVVEEGGGVRVAGVLDEDIDHWDVGKLGVWV